VQAQAQDDECSFHKLLTKNTLEAQQLYNRKEYAQSVELLEQLRRDPNLVQSDDKGVSVLYDLACIYSLLREKDKALKALGEAVTAGFVNPDQMRDDSDLNNIRQEPEYKKLFAEVEARNKAQVAFWSGAALNTKYRDNLTEDEKIAGLSRLWSEAKYNFAFFDRLPNLDWDGTYFAYLPRVRTSKSTVEYYMILTEFCAQLHDGHTRVGPPQEMRDLMGYPPVSTRLIEGRVFISAVREPKLEAIRGLEIVTVEGMPVKDYGNTRVAPFVFASTPQDLDRRTFEAQLLGGLKDSPVELTLQDRAGKTQKTTLPRMTDVETNKLPPIPWQRFAFKMLPGGIAYVALNAFGNEAIVKDFDAAFPEIQKSNALILDVRENGGGSSNIGYGILSYLSAKPFLSSQWSTRDYRPSFRAWGNPDKWYSGGPDPFPPHGGSAYTKAVVVLTSAQTYSAAEDFVVAFDSMKRGTIVGEPTGGSTGQPLPFALPGGGFAQVCSKHDRYPDGKEFVGIGVQPQLTVHPTVSDFREGRDTVLLAALKFLTHEH
jgi:C-terminal processing protease CtpA/Prc